ncbi:hypothetical protein N7497_006087 [Penicillium chrysogenum]|jgi:hypothetical protein|uniref:Uncharacterized protein n=1 Tax=Penicillium chrysogenum TaxID=5076 RepID=A0ABQ8WUR0_PENCH|nr:hypothetical protein N7505_004020 [Penicillium chrysogenum]KAJ6157202.1 hypothetical protein N7497_006087 [Penicillium chrysogenum]
MHLTTTSPEIYGPGSFMENGQAAVPDGVLRISNVLAKATPGFDSDPSICDKITFEGGADPIIPGPIKAPAVAAALHAMCGVIANEILDERDGEQPDRRVVINTDHAAFWLGTVGLVKWNGVDLSDIWKAGKLGEVFKTDFEQGAFGTPLRMRATANYPTKTPGIWYQLHGSLRAVPVLRAIGINPASPFVRLPSAPDALP